MESTLLLRRQCWRRRPGVHRGHGSDDGSHGEFGNLANLFVCAAMCTNCIVKEFNLRDKIASKTEFIFVGEDFDGQQHRDDSYIPEGGRCPPVGLCKPHGTSMLSIIAGANIGIAKKVKPIMVRVPRRREAGGGAQPKDWINAMSAVADAFYDKSATTRAILCMAQGHKFEDFRMDWESENKKEGQDNEKLLSEAWISFRETMHGILAGLIEKGVFIVTGAGNDGVVSSSNVWR